MQFSDAFFLVNRKCVVCKLGHEFCLNNLSNFNDHNLTAKILWKKNQVKIISSLFALIYFWYFGFQNAIELDAKATKSLEK